MRMKLTEATIRSLKAPPTGQRLEVWDRFLPSFGLRITDKDARSWQIMYRTGVGEGRKQRRLRLGDASS